VSALAFELPPALEAREPPEARGLGRDEVRLLVADRASGGLSHRVFRELPELLRAGDLAVINVSATLPAAVLACRADGDEGRVHFSTRAPGLDQDWRVVEVRTADGAKPQRSRAGERFTLDGGAILELVAPYASGARLMLARFHGGGSVESYLAEHGEPIRYGYVAGSWPLAAYQNVYATTPGSAEMPSAGRPFTAEGLHALVARGITLAPITLHAGVSSPERDEPPFPEQFEVPPSTAALVRTVKARGGRVIAVGTSVVRALESAVAADGTISPSAGWTGLVVTPEHRPRVVDGLITGWHEPEASHLWLLEAIAGAELVAASYRAALARGYLWHEFGDSHLILA